MEAAHAREAPGRRREPGASESFAYDEGRKAHYDPGRVSGDARDRAAPLGAGPAGPAGQTGPAELTQASAGPDSSTRTIVQPSRSNRAPSSANPLLRIGSSSS